MFSLTKCLRVSSLNNVTPYCDSRQRPLAIADPRNTPPGAATNSGQTTLQSLLYDGSTALLCQPKYPFCDKTLDHPLTRRMCLCVSKQQNFCQVRLTSSGKEDIDDDVKKILDFKYNYAVILGHYVVANTRNIISESSPVKYLERRPQLGPASASPTQRRKLRQELTPAQEISCSAAVTHSNEISQ